MQQFRKLAIDYRTYCLFTSLSITTLSCRAKLCNFIVRIPTRKQRYSLLSLGNLFCKNISGQCRAASIRIYGAKRTRYLVSRNRSDYT